MALQLSVALRTAMAAAVETAIGASPTLEIRTGAPPANCAAADTGTLLASLALPADYLTAASAGAVTLNGVWSDPAADASGNAGHFRLKQGATVHAQGTVTGTVTGTGDVILAQATEAIVSGQTVSFTGFTLTQGGA
jgi:hypothetical protein